MSAHDDDALTERDDQIGDELAEREQAAGGWCAPVDPRYDAAWPVAPVQRRRVFVPENDRTRPQFSYWWKFVHNAVIHPLLAFPWTGPRWLERAHDWTGERCQGAG